MNYLAKRAFGPARRRETYRKLATMARYGLSVRQGLVRFRDRNREKGSLLAHVFGSVLSRLDQGQTLDKAFAGWVPQEELMLIRAGGRGGNLAQALVDCAGLIESQAKITEGVVAAVAYPGLLFGLLTAFMVFLSLYVMPEVTALSDPKGWTGAAATLYALTSFIASPAGVATFLAGLTLLAAAIGTLPYWTGPSRLWVEKLPPWSIYRLVTGSVWLFTVATLLRGHIQMETVFSDLLGSGVMKPWLSERVAAIKKLYRSEGNLGRILIRLNMHFPDDELLDDLADYASLPNFNETLYGIAKEWLEGGVKRVAAMSKALNGALMFSIVASACWLALALRSLQEQLISGIGGM